MRSLHFIFPLSIFILATLSCSKSLPWEPKSEDGTPELLALGLLSNSPSATPVAREPRPFRGRSIFVYSSGSVVYDWNNDANVSTLRDLNSSATSPVETENGRFALVNPANTEFKIADSGLNLSPHGDHYHVDKTNPTVILGSRLALNLGTPIGAFSKNGKSSFVFANGLVRFLEEKNLISQSSPTLESLANVPAINSQSTVVWLNASKAIATDGGGFRFYTNRTAGTIESPANAPTCTNPGFPATHQTPISSQIFTNLNLEFSYNHTVVYPCDNGTRVIRHVDSNNTGAGTYTFLSSGSTRFTNWKPLFRNNNYSVFGRTTKPIFFGNGGSDSETSLVRLDGETGLTSTLSSPAYRSQNFATEEMLGKQIAILRNDGILAVYDANELTLIRELRFLPADAILSGTDAPRLYSTWNACFAHYTDSKGVHYIQEFNLEEALVTRKITLDAKPQAITFHVARMKGADYEGPAHQ